MLTSSKVPTVLQLVEEIDSFSKAEEESEVKQNHSFVAEITPIIVDAGEKECESVQDDLDARAGVYLRGVLVGAGQRAQGPAHRPERCKNGNLTLSHFCAI